MPKLIKTFRLPQEINFYSYMKDHKFADRTVLPAVETCSILSACIKKQFPEINFFDIYNASFGKFIDIDPDLNALSAINNIDVYENGTIVSKLLSKAKSKSGITRTNEHASLEFRKQQELFQELTYDVASAPDGICFQVSPDKVYGDLVPFGPAYRNITGTLYVFSSGAVADVLASQTKTSGAIGSPFPFDAALHAASVWSQRYYGTVAFPVSFDRRVVLKLTVPGERYRARIIAKKAEANNFAFDIWIYDNEGCLCEAGFGVVLKDVTAGRMKPPEWIIDKNNAHPLENISGECEAFSIIETSAISNFAEKALTDEEAARLGPMVEKRRRSYMGARLSCKFLSRKLAGGDSLTPANKIKTVAEEIYPVCPLPDGSMPFKCSVSHDNRFAIAVASKKRIGIDVEDISDRAFKAGHLFMSKEEQELVNSSVRDKKIASLKVWSIKECVTKALRIGLSESWKTCRVVEIGDDISVLLIDNSETIAYHAAVDDHLFTLVKFEDYCA